MAKKKHQLASAFVGRRGPHDIEMTVIAEVMPDDPEFKNLDPGETARTLAEAWEMGMLVPDCPLCMALLEHPGPSILTKMAIDP